MSEHGHIETKNAKGNPADRDPNEINRVPGSDQPSQDSTKPVASQPDHLSGTS